MYYETTRLILRPWREEDAAELFRYAADPEVGPPAGWPPHTDIENSRMIIREILSAEGTFAVVLKATGLPIGSIGIMRNTNVSTAADEAEIGYWIGRPYWGQGLIPEAVQECLRICFQEQGCSRVWCAYFEGNEKSRRVQEKCGFRYHHTEQNKECPMLNEIRTEHITALEKGRWIQRQILLEPGQNQPEALHPLFEAYTAALVEQCPDFCTYLTKQNYDAELLHPEEKYGEPYGRLYLLRFAGEPAGCIALHQIDGKSCELKRLYVRPEYRGLGLAAVLVEQILQDARQIGYRRILLDTFPDLTAAIRLYKKYGFYEIPSYNGSPMDELIYLQLDL